MSGATEEAACTQELPPMAGHQVHLGIAEQGKVLALGGRHRDALTHYREALRLANVARAPQLIAAHYLQCVLESLEHLQDYESMISLSNEALARQPANAGEPFTRRSRAHLLERRAVAEYKAGRATAKQTLSQAIAEAGPGQLPLAEQLAAWLSRGLAVPAARLVEAQRRHAYFVVRPELVDRRRAIVPGAGFTQALSTNHPSGGIRG